MKFYARKLNEPQTKANILFRLSFKIIANFMDIYWKHAQWTATAILF